MEEWKKIKQQFVDMEEDVVKFFESDNKKAGARVRTGLRTTKNMMKELQDKILARSKSL